MEAIDARLGLHSHMVHTSKEAGDILHEEPEGIVLVSRQTGIWRGDEYRDFVKTADALEIKVAGICDKHPKSGHMDRMPLSNNGIGLIIENIRTGPKRERTRVTELAYKLSDYFHTHPDDVRY